MVTIDGSYGEGGGQIIRTSLALSAITQNPVTINNIRANRSKPGLIAQHLTACKAVSQISQGTLKHADLHSTHLTFIPGDIQHGQYHFDVGTAGSVVLVAQTIIPILLYASKPSHVTIIGGTHVIKSPGYDYFSQVFLPAIAQFGAKVSAKAVRTGYYPKGGGKIEVNIQPSQLLGCCLWPEDKNTHAIIRLGNLPEHIAEREATVLKEHGINDINIIKQSTYSAGNPITIWQGFSGSYALGERGKRAEHVAQEAIDQFNTSVEVDKYLADQLLLYAALAKNGSRYQTSEITSHLRTNLYIIQQFLDREFQIKDNVVHCK